ADSSVVRAAAGTDSLPDMTARVTASEAPHSLVGSHPPNNDGSTSHHRWQTWTQVPDLFSSPPNATHCVTDPACGEVRFGDGVHGAIPPQGPGLIRVTFRTGGGRRGNVGAGALTVLRRSI